ncbi:MAG: 6-phosphogluconolactonase [Pseudomonadales bacterium]
MNLQSFNDRHAASVAVADRITTLLREALNRQPRATLVVSGGTSPVQCFTALSGTRLPWERVNVTLTDERLVPADHEASNERLVRSHLLLNAASRATFVPLRPESIAPIVSPFACALVGMGEDGHFASLFPDAPNLADALDISNPAPLITIRTAGSPYPRVSMTLARLLRSDRILLLVFGAAKRRLLEASAGYPVNALLAQDTTPVEIFWAP